MPKIELTKTNRQLKRLQLVQRRAEFRTNQRIQKVLDEQKLKEMEAEGIEAQVVSQVRAARGAQKESK